MYIPLSGYANHKCLLLRMSFFVCVYLRYNNFHDSEEPNQSKEEVEDERMAL